MNREQVELKLAEVLKEYPLPEPAPVAQVKLTAMTVATRLVGFKTRDWWKVRSTALSILGTHGSGKRWFQEDTIPKFLSRLGFQRNSVGDWVCHNLEVEAVKKLQEKGFTVRAQENVGHTFVPCNVISFRPDYAQIIKGRKTVELFYL